MTSAPFASVPATADAVDAAAAASAAAATPAPGTVASGTPIVASKYHGLIVVGDADLARIIGLIEGVGRFHGASIPMTTSKHFRRDCVHGETYQCYTETITLVYPGFSLPIWTSVSLTLVPGATSVHRPTHLVKPRPEINCVVYATEGVFERLCGCISGLYSAMIPLSCSQ